MFLNLFVITLISFWYFLPYLISFIQTRLYLLVQFEFVCVYVCLSICPSVRPPVCLVVSLPICPDILQSVPRSTYSSIYLSIHLSIYLSIYPSICQSIYAPILLPCIVSYNRFVNAPDLFDFILIPLYLIISFYLSIGGDTIS